MSAPSDGLGSLPKFGSFKLDRGNTMVSSASGLSKSAASSAKTKFETPLDNAAANRPTLTNIAKWDKLETKVRNGIKAAKSVSQELMTKAEFRHDASPSLFPDGESRLCDVTTVRALDAKLGKQAKIMTQGFSQGAEKQRLCAAILELQDEVKTTFTFPLSVLFFFIFAFTFGTHYKTYAILLQEQNLRNQLTGGAGEVGEPIAIFDWLEQSWFPFLWSTSNAVGDDDSITPSRDLNLIAGSMLKVVRTPIEPCEKVKDKDCYPQFERAYDPDPVLNGWSVNRRLLSTQEETDEEKSWSRTIAEQWHSWRHSFFPEQESWYKAFPDTAEPETSQPTEEPEQKRSLKRPRKKKIKESRMLKHGLKGLPKKRGSAKSKRFGWMYAGIDESKRRKPRTSQKAQGRRLVETTSDILEGLPQAYGYDKAYTKIIPMSMSTEDISATIQDWKSASNQLLTDNTAVFTAETMVRNDELGVLTHVFVHFLLSRSGAVFTQVKFRSVRLDTSLATLVCAPLWGISLLLLLVTLVVQVITACTNGKASIHLSKLSTLLQCVIVAGGLVILVFFVVERAEMGRATSLIDEWLDARAVADVRTLQTLDSSWFRKVHDVIFLSAKLDSENVLLIALYHVCMLFQFLVAAKGNARLAVLTNTLELAFQDILHLFVVFCFIFFAFVFAGHTLFGTKLPDYSTVLGATSRALQQAVSFETNFDVISVEDWIAGAIWIWGLIIIVSFIVINIVLAVIFDAYGVVCRYITEQDTLLTTASRQSKAFFLRKKWYSSVDLLTGLQSSKAETFTKDDMKIIFKGITDEQLDQVFGLAELRAVSSTVKDSKTLLGEAVSSLMVGVDDMRDKIRRIQGHSFISNREAKIWLDDQKLILDPPPVLTDKGPGLYIVLNDVKIRAAPDLDSDDIGLLTQDDKVDLIQTKDYDGGPGLMRLFGQMVSGGWITIFDPESGYSWADIWVDPNVREEDFPGMYTVLHDGAYVREDISLTSPVVSELREGRMVNVVEVVTSYHDHEEQVGRKRARITNPNGWISLLDTDNGHRFAVRSSIQEPCGRYAILQDKAEVRVDPESPDVQSLKMAGDIVSVEEVRRYSDGNAERLTGRIEGSDGAGWIILKDLKTGMRYAELKEEKTFSEVPAKMPRDAPRWAKDGLLQHLARQQRHMVEMTEQFQRVMQGLNKMGVSAATEGTAPEKPDFVTMLKPAHNAVRPPGMAALRRDAPVVNMPRPSMEQSSPVLKTRLSHTVTEI